MGEKVKDMPLMEDTSETINICYPFIGSKSYRICNRHIVR